MDAYGNYSNEFEAAYDASRRAGFDTDAAKIEALVAEGKFVVGMEVEQYCRHTDAALGVSKHILSVHDTLQAAEAAVPAFMDQFDPAYFVTGPGVAEAARNALDAELYGVYGSAPADEAGEDVLF